MDYHDRPIGLLIVLSLGLGGLAIYNMNNVSTQSTMLAKEYVPEVRVATDIRGAANRLAFAMRGYGFTEREQFYQQAMGEMAAIDKGLEDGGALAVEAKNLKKLGGALEKISNAKNSYGKSIAETRQVVGKLQGDRGELDKNAGLYMKASAEFLEGQNQAFNKDLAERQKKINIVSHLVALGSEVRVMNFKAQATRDYDLLEKAATELDKVKDMTGDLKKATRDQEDLECIKTTAAAAAGYQKAMRAFLSEFKKGDAADATALDGFRMAMDKNAGTYVKACDEFLKGQQQKLSKDMTERHAKITLTNDVIDLGNDTRVKAFKSQALIDPAIMKDALQNFPKIAAKFEELKKITRLKLDLDRIDQVAAAANGYSAALKSYLAGYARLQELGEIRNQAAAVTIAASADLTKAGLGHASSIADEAMHALDNASSIMMLGLGIAFVLGIVLAVFITRSITGPVNRVIAGLTLGSQQVSSAATEVSTASQQLASGASQQAASLEETSSSLEEMASMTRQNADNATQADNMMKETSGVVDQANSSMVELRAAMEKINQASDETAKIIKTIDEIAFQTNLLALNAAVEAARAGEAGAGFAVVADEVRNLAMRAAEAAKGTSGLIEDNIKDIKEGSVLVTTTDEAFQQVKQNADKVGELVGEIAAASKEQSQGIDQVNNAMTDMDKVTQQNASSAEESAAASEELNAQANSMEGIVGDLVAIVGDSRRGKSARAVAKLPGPSRKLTLESKAKSIPQLKQTPEKIIPLADEDFADF